MTPYSYLPSPDADNGPALRNLIATGERWIQIAGDECPIRTTVRLLDSNGKPAHGLVIEPAPGIERVRIDVSGIGRDPTAPTNPSYAGFEYSGNETPAGFLASAAIAGDSSVGVNDGTLYGVDGWIFLSAASTDPNHYLLPQDGPMEVRRVVSIDENKLTLDRPLKRAFPANAIACHCEPLFDARFRDLCFVGDAAVGLHMHLAHNCTYTRITSADWRGRAMLLIDNGGRDNVIAGCFCVGTEPGGGVTQNTWGVAVEGQDGTRILNSGGMRCANGLIANYCIDTSALEPVAHSNNVNVYIGFSSLRTTVTRPFTATGVQMDCGVSSDSVNCLIQDRQDYSCSSIASLGDRRLPVTVAPANTDRFLITTNSGSAMQLSSDSVILRDASGAVIGDRFEIKSSKNFSGNFRVTNTLRSWLAGMLGAPGSQDYTVVDLTAGVTRFSISGTDGSVSYGGNLNPFQGGVYDLGAGTTPWRDLYVNRHVRSGSGVFVAGIQVLREQRAARPDLFSTATLSDVIAKVNAILADERAMGLRATAAAEV